MAEALEPSHGGEATGESAAPEPSSAEPDRTEEFVAASHAQAFAASEASVAAVAAPDATAVAPAIDRAAEMRTPGGSIDELFGNRPPGTSEDSAAAALAQAFGSKEDQTPPLTGRPARAASGELSLDSVFRDGPARPPRTSQSFSFDQFFSESATSGNVARTSGSHRTSQEVPTAPEAPAERSADDIEQFNSWLQGLKQR